MSRRFALALALLLAPAAAPAGGRAADPWHLPGWQARAVVEVKSPAEPGVDTAAVRVLCQGAAKPDGSDYRVLDAGGKPVPFQLTFHDAGRYSLVAFRADAPGRRFFVYFGNPGAARAPEHVDVDPKPGSGPPKAAWVPRAGFVLQTLQRPRGPNPETPDEMAKLIAGSAAKYGAKYQRRVADGYNPFGPSDYYISVYRGWIRVPKDDTYSFCTASNEASFSFLDGKELVHWPGQHTAERGVRGEVRATLRLSAGLHYLEYYHEEVTLEQMAFLGWKPPGAPYFVGIPEEVYTAPTPAEVTRYEDPKGQPLARFEPVLLDSVWPVERYEGQYTRFKFAAPTAGFPAGTTFAWEFGDGTGGSGPEAAHVFLAEGEYAVTLTAAGPQGTSTARWPLLVYDIREATDQYKDGVITDYAAQARSYDRTKLAAAPLFELANLLAETEDPAGAVAVLDLYLKRFPGGKPLEAARVRRLLADCKLRLGPANSDEAIANYQAALVPEMPDAERLDTLARLIRVVGIDRNMPDKAGEVFGRLEDAWKKIKTKDRDDEAVAAFRRGLIAAGDVLLWHGKLDGCRPFYERAETWKGFVPSQVRAARIGSYPNSIREYLAANNLTAAFDVVDKWEQTFPTDKVNGHTFFWRGKLLTLRGKHHEAARLLARSIGLSPGSAHESEARWLLAGALEAAGKPQEAKVELAKLIRSGMNDEFTKKAKAKLGS